MMIRLCFTVPLRTPTAYSHCVLMEGGVDQLLGHDSAPIFHPALRVRNWASLNRSGSDALSLVIKSLSVVSGFLSSHNSTLRQTPSKGSLRVRQ